MFGVRPRWLLALLLSISVVGCGEIQNGPAATVHPTSSLEASPFTPSPTLGINRDTLEQVFESIGFPPFMGHGAAELVSSSLPNSMGALVIVEIYGPAADVEAVEMWMTLSTDMAVASVAALTLLDATSPDWAERDSWFDGAIAGLEQGGEVVETHGNRLYTLRSLPTTGSLFFGVEGVYTSGTGQSTR